MLSIVLLVYVLLLLLMLLLLLLLLLVLPCAVCHLPVRRRIHDRAGRRRAQEGRRPGQQPLLLLRTVLVPVCIPRVRSVAVFVRPYVAASVSEVVLPLP